jgi:hypothetical protein
VGTKIAIVLAMIHDAHGVAIPEALAPARVTSTLDPAKPDGGLPADTVTLA